MSPVALVLEELVQFAAANGTDIADLVRGFTVARPELVRPGTEGAPPAEGGEAVDEDVDRMIQRGEL